MGWTKRQFIEHAFSEVGLASYAFDISPEQLNRALWTLDAMMAAWNEQGIRLGYPLPSSPNDSTLDEQTNVPDRANEAIYTNLALRLANTVGRQPMEGTKAMAKQAYDLLLKRAAIPRDQQLPNTLPVGAGNKPWHGGRSPFMPTPEDPITVGPDGLLDLQ